MKKLATLLASLAAALLLTAAPAAAHGGPGEARITSITRSGDDVTVTVHLVFTGDGDGVPDATVTVVVDDGLPVTMEPGAEEGDYTATVPAAEGAAIRVTSVEPATSVEGTAPAAETATTATTAATTEPEATTTTSGEDSPTTQAPADTAPGPNGIDEAPDDDSGTGGTTVVLVVVVVVIIAALGAGFLLRRKRPDQV